MSLYSREEVCKGCKFAVFHECCEKFCKCKINGDVDCIMGECPDMVEGQHAVIGQNVNEKYREALEMIANMGLDAKQCRDLAKRTLENN